MRTPGGSRRRIAISFSLSSSDTLTPSIFVACALITAIAVSIAR
jgi:hypothetical protein